jgi:hypothetical protein
VDLCTYTAIDLEAHKETWAKTNAKPRNDPYFWPFQNTITAAMLSLWDAGWRERFEVIFDEQMISGPRAKKWYPLMKRVAQFKEPEAATLLPVEPLFKTDDEFLPIQAADLFAWCIRKATDDPSYTNFAWLLDELKSVKQSVYAQYYDRQRMTEVSEESVRLANEGETPQDIVDMARDLRT